MVFLEFSASFSSSSSNLDGWLCRLYRLWEMIEYINEILHNLVICYYIVVVVVVKLLFCLSLSLGLSLGSAVARYKCAFIYICVNNAFLHYWILQCGLGFVCVYISSTGA